MQRRIFVVGAFPPPVTGAAAITLAVFELLVERGGRVVKLSTIHRGRLSFSRIFRPLQVWKEFIRWILSRPQRTDTMYISLSGGYAQLYEACFAGCARIFGSRTVIHHHSFRYLDRRWFPFQLFLALAGSRATHIFLCETMRAKFHTLYGKDRRTTVLSNRAFRLADQNPTDIRPLRRVGYLSNICFSKGLKNVVHLARVLQQRGSALGVVIAGGFVESSAAEWFAKQRQTLSNVTYLGPVQGGEKQDFFHSIEAFVFPTEYCHEAEPLVLIEAMNRCIPVVANRRGCIEEMIPQAAGVSVKKAECFVEIAAERLIEWERDPRRYSEICETLKKAMETENRRWEVERAAFVTLLTTGDR